MYKMKKYFSIFIVSLSMSACSNTGNQAQAPSKIASSVGSDKIESIIAQLVVSSMVNITSRFKTYYVKDGEIAGPKNTVGFLNEAYQIYCVKFKIMSRVFNTDFIEREQVVKIYEVNGKPRASTNAQPQFGGSECTELKFKPLPEFLQFAKNAGVAPQ